MHDKIEQKVILVSLEFMPKHSHTDIVWIRCCRYHLYCYINISFNVNSAAGDVKSGEWNQQAQKSAETSPFPERKEEGKNLHNIPRAVQPKENAVFTTK